jgi:hypothetical protein
MSKFLRIFLLNPNFLLAHRNRYSEGMDEGQKTQHGHPNLIPMIKIYVFWYSRQTDGRTDRQTDRQRHTLTARGLEELFSAVLERFLEPIHNLHVYCKN